MYLSSEGEKINVSTMHYEHLVNALSKCQREIFNTKNVEEFNVIMNNIQVLEHEIYERIDAFLKGKMNDERWI